MTRSHRLIMTRMVFLLTIFAVLLASSKPALKTDEKKLTPEEIASVLVEAVHEISVEEVYTGGAHFWRIRLDEIDLKTIQISNCSVRGVWTLIFRLSNVPLRFHANYQVNFEDEQIIHSKQDGKASENRLRQKRGCNGLLFGQTKRFWAEFNATYIDAGRTLQFLSPYYGDTPNIDYELEGFDLSQADYNRSIEWANQAFAGGAGWAGTLSDAFAPALTWRLNQYGLDQYKCP